jgi:hypothetical protein
VSSQGRKTSKPAPDERFLNKRTIAAIIFNGFQKRKGGSIKVLILGVRGRGKGSAKPALIQRCRFSTVLVVGCSEAYRDLPIQSLDRN